MLPGHHLWERWRRLQLFRRRQQAAKRRRQAGDPKKQQEVFDLEIRQSVRGAPGRAVVLALALLAVLALALVAWQLTTGATSSPPTRSVPVKTTNGLEAGRAADSERLAAEARQAVKSPDRVPTHGALP
jgi:hypothetical protein